MANYRKSFNLRSGVQVDDDNFIVNPNGLVGIGTSVPREFLDVLGNAKISGLVTTSNFYAGVATVGFLTASNIRTSGVITATTFYGSAAGLTGIYAVAVDGWRVTSGSISTTSNIGIGTTNPQGALQVGVAITFNSNGNATYAGIVTAVNFNGDGSNITSLNASNISSGTLSNSRLPSNINLSGIITATSGFVGNVTGNLTGNVTGTVTGNVTGTASTAQSLTGTPDIVVGTITASSIGVGIVTVGISTVFTTSHVGSGGTVFSALTSGRIGIGTALPTSEFQIRNPNSILLEVVSDTAESKISIGQSVGVGKSTGVLRFGNSPKTLDIINNDTGNINLYLHNGPAGVGTGRFSWIYGQLNVELASLTYDGKFGLGIANPSNTLHVVGTSTVTGNSYVGQNLTVNGTIDATTFNLPSILTKNINSNSGISTFNNVNVQGILTTGNVNCQTGTGIFAGLGINTSNPVASFQVYDGIAIFDRIGVGTTALRQNQNATIPKFQSSVDFYVYGSAFNVNNSTNSSIGFGTEIPKAAIDFSNVGSTSGTIGTIRGYMLPPFVSSTTRSGMGATEPGAIIFNTTTKKHQGYGSTNGGSTYGWQDLY